MRDGWRGFEGGNWRWRGEMGGGEVERVGGGNWRWRGGEGGRG